ncbi:hypothetical protein ACQEVX_03490 [Streptomyces syringium]
MITLAASRKDCSTRPQASWCWNAPPTRTMGAIRAWGWCTMRPLYA